MFIRKSSGAWLALALFCLGGAAAAASLERLACPEGSRWVRVKKTDPRFEGCFTAKKEWVGPYRRVTDAGEIVERGFFRFGQRVRTAKPPQAGGSPAIDKYFQGAAGGSTVLCPSGLTPKEARDGRLLLQGCVDAGGKQDGPYQLVHLEYKLVLERGFYFGGVKQVMASEAVKGFVDDGMPTTQDIDRAFRPAKSAAYPALGEQPICGLGRSVLVAPQGPLLVNACIDGNGAPDGPYELVDARTGSVTERGLSWHWKQMPMPSKVAKPQR